MDSKLHGSMLVDKVEKIRAKNSLISLLNRVFDSDGEIELNASQTCGVSLSKTPYKRNGTRTLSIEIRVDGGARDD